VERPIGLRNVFKSRSPVHCLGVSINNKPSCVTGVTDWMCCALCGTTGGVRACRSKTNSTCQVAKSVELCYAATRTGWRTTTAYIKTSRQITSACTRCSYGTQYTVHHLDIKTIHLHDCTNQSFRRVLCINAKIVFKNICLFLMHSDIIAFSLVWLLLLGCYIKVFTDFSLTVQ